LHLKFLPTVLNCPCAKSKAEVHSDPFQNSSSGENIMWFSSTLCFPKQISNEDSSKHLLRSLSLFLCYYLSIFTYQVYCCLYVCKYVQYDKDKHYQNPHHYQDKEQTHSSTISSCFSVIACSHNLHFNAVVNISNYINTDNYCFLYLLIPFLFYYYKRKESCSETICVTYPKIQRC
jgi:hypothetical protein